MKGGAWPFLVGGAICQANPDNERDLSLLTSWRKFSVAKSYKVTSLLREGLLCFFKWWIKKLVATS